MGVRLSWEPVGIANVAIVAVADHRPGRAIMLRKIVLIGLVSLFSASVAVAQKNSSPDSTAGGAAGTSKQGMEKQVKTKKASKKSGGQESSPDSTAGGAAGTSKDSKKKN